MKKILLPVDFSEGSQKAARVALELANRLVAEIHVLHIVEFPPYAGFPNVTWVTAQMLEDAKNEAQQRLVAYTNTLGKDVPITHHLEINEPNAPKAICKHASDGKADLIVIAKHGRRGLDKFLLGSVTEKVIRMAPCAVLTVPVE